MSTLQSGLLTHGSFYKPSLPSITAPVGILSSGARLQAKATNDGPIFVPAYSGTSLRNYTVLPPGHLQRTKVGGKLPKNGRSCQGKSRRRLRLFSCLTKPRDSAITYLLLDGSLRGAGLVSAGEFEEPPQDCLQQRLRRDMANIQEGRRLRGRPTGRTCGSGP
jgi:hypothetical protein